MKQDEKRALRERARQADDLALLCTHYQTALRAILDLPSDSGWDRDEGMLTHTYTEPDDPWNIARAALDSPPV